MPWSVEVLMFLKRYIRYEMKLGVKYVPSLEVETNHSSSNTSVSWIPDVKSLKIFCF